MYMVENKYPILYSFRRCPYAMRARLALQASGVLVEIREIKLQNKPEELLQCSPKGTVPVLILNSEEVLDESLDIIWWALKISDQKNWLTEGQLNQVEINKILNTIKYDFKQNHIQTVSLSIFMFVKQTFKTTTRLNMCQTDHFSSRI